MQLQTKSRSPLLLVTALLVLFCTIFIFSISSCKWPLQKKRAKENTVNTTVSWNILFKPGTNSAQRAAYINDVKKYINTFYIDFNAKNTKNYHADTISMIYCPCDSLLYNLNFNPVDGAGGSVTTAPTTKRGVKAGGDQIDAIISINIPIKNGLAKDPVPFYKKSVIHNFEIDSTKKLAIIDSGIDTAFFEPALKSLLWTQSNNIDTFNFLAGGKLNDVTDQSREKHGTAVASVAINAMAAGVARTYPKMMILKALDKIKFGEYFFSKLCYELCNKK